VVAAHRYGPDQDARHPSRVKQRLPHLSNADLLVLDVLIREALEELADRGEPDESNNGRFWRGQE
jgi:phage terminase Nu1 subunit (DNA packaging protein)